jgi:hypothetical protein
MQMPVAAPGTRCRKIRRIQCRGVARSNQAPGLTKKEIQKKSMREKDTTKPGFVFGIFITGEKVSFQVSPFERFLERIE